MEWRNLTFRWEVSLVKMLQQTEAVFLFQRWLRLFFCILNWFGTESILTFFTFNIHCWCHTLFFFIYFSANFSFQLRWKSWVPLSSSLISEATPMQNTHVLQHTPCSWSQVSLLRNLCRRSALKLSGGQSAEVMWHKKKMAFTRLQLITDHSNE